MRTGRSTVDFYWDSSLLDVGYSKNWHIMWVLDKQTSSQRMGMSLMDDSGVLGQVEG